MRSQPGTLAIASWFIRQSATMEIAMKQKKSDRGYSQEPNRPGKPQHGRVQGADARQALWSLGLVVAVAIILGVTFYGINAQRESQTAASPPPPATMSESPAQTTGQGGSPESDQGGAAAK
jgi:hypothetical protein